MTFIDKVAHRIGRGGGIIFVTASIVAALITIQSLSTDEGRQEEDDTEKSVSKKEMNS